MSSETKWIIGTGVVLASLMLTQGERVSSRLDRLDDRLRTVEIDMAQVMERLAGIDRRLSGMDLRLVGIEDAHRLSVSPGE